MALLAIATIAAKAEIKLPATICNNMVLQRNANVNLWGYATPNKAVVITSSWNKKRYSTTANSTGKWQTKIATPNAGGPYSLTINDGKPVVVSNVLIGEVWICSGQSNMEMPVHGFMGQPVDNSTAEILESAAYPQIRLFTVKQNAEDTPTEDCQGNWLITSPESVGHFSATAYFFGKNLYKILGIPIGLISTNWGGTSIEAWMSKEALDNTKDINLEIAYDGKDSGVAPFKLYNGMIYPITNYTAKGFIWYQGESNKKNYFDYDKLLPSMVSLWREKWGDTNMSFFYVELAPYTYDNKDGIILPLLIEAQHKALKTIPNAAISASSDIGHASCIHPSPKPVVGQRLAMLALKYTYETKGLPADAPKVKAIEYKEGKALLTFTPMPGDFQWNEPDSFNYFIDGPLLGFEIAGADKKFYPAKASHAWWKGVIEVSSDFVSSPVAVRYAFRNIHRGNVVTTAGQPLTPFRSDSWDDSF